MTLLDRISKSSSIVRTGCTEWLASTSTVSTEPSSQLAIQMLYTVQMTSLLTIWVRIAQTFNHSKETHCTQSSKRPQPPTRTSLSTTTTLSSKGSNTWTAKSHMKWHKQWRPATSSTTCALMQAALSMCKELSRIESSNLRRWTKDLQTTLTTKKMILRMLL